MRTVFLAVGAQGAPQGGLPLFMPRVEAVLAALPRLEEVVPEQLVIVESRGHLSGESKTHPIVTAAEIARHRRVARVTQIHLAQQRIHAPRQGLARKRVDVVFRHPHRGGQRADEACRERQLH